MNRAFVKRTMAQCTKELAQFWRDRLTVALAFVLPVLALLLYGYATRLEAKNIPIAIFNYDSGKLSHDYIDRLFANDQLEPAKWPKRAAFNSDAFGPIDYGVAKASIIIPPEFSRTVKSGLTAHVQAVIDATDVNNARIIKSSILATTNYFLQSEGLSDTKQLIKPEIRLWFNPGRKESLYVVPGAIALVLWIFPCLLAALAMVREKEQGTILQLYASSLTAKELVLGKALAYLAVGLIEAFLVTSCAMIVFGLRFAGSPIAFLLSTILYLLASVMFGLMAGSRTNTQGAAVQLVAMTGFTSAMLLSGFLYPLRNITFPLSLVSYVVPARYYVEASRDCFVRGGNPFAHWYVPVMLLLCSLFFFRNASRLMARMQLSS